MGRPRDFRCGNNNEFANDIPSHEALVIHGLWLFNHFTALEQKDR